MLDGDVTNGDSSAIVIQVDNRLLFQGQWDAQLRAHLSHRRTRRKGVSLEMLVVFVM